MPKFRPFPIVALVAALGAPLAAGAQTPPSPPSSGDAAPAAPADGGMQHEHHRHASFMRALRAVNLTPAQQQQVAAFHDAEKKANLNADDLTRKANAKKMRDQIMGILTPDQKTQLSAELHRSRHLAAPAGASAPNPAPSPAAN